MPIRPDHPVSIKSLGELSRIEISSWVYSIWFYSDSPEKSYDLAMYWAADVGIVDQFLTFTIDYKDLVSYPLGKYGLHLVVRMHRENQPYSYNCEVIASRVCYKYNIDTDNPLK
jgi:hypothetical protein